MRAVVKYDCSRKKEITLYLNDRDQVVGVEIFFESPVDLLDFNFAEIINKRFPIERSVVHRPPETQAKNIIRTAGGKPVNTKPVKTGCCND